MPFIQLSIVLDTQMNTFCWSQRTYHKTLEQMQNGQICKVLAFQQPGAEQDLPCPSCWLFSHNHARNAGGFAPSTMRYLY